MNEIVQEILRGRFGASHDAVINYLPDEVCVVVEGDALVREPPAVVYAVVQRQLNALLREVLAQEPRSTDDPFLRDTDPATLRQVFGKDRSVLDRGLLQPVRRPDLEVPSVTFAPSERNLIARIQPRSLLFYQIGPNPLPPAAAADRQLLVRHVALVRELSNLVNLRLKTLASRNLDGGLRIVAATPNWLQVAAPNSCGSPGGLPVPVHGEPPIAGRELIAFQDAGLDASARAAAAGATDPRAIQPSGIVVAVLDTCPDLHPDPATPEGTRRQAWLDHLDRTNWLFHQVRLRATLDDGPSLPSAALTHLDPILPNWNNPDGSERDRFQIADHGLFVAGIVQHLVPAAEIHLLRVLNDFGVGDLLGIARVASELPTRFLASGGKRLIVNLSLGSDVPVGERRVLRWLPNVAVSAPTLRQRQADINTLLDLAQESLQTIFAWLEREDVVVVAAAGNDNLPDDPSREEPRWPAHFDSVLGVAALKGDGSPADYTNLGDERVVVDGNGVATFGGNATQPAPNEPRVTDSHDAVVGIVSADTFPFSGDKNENGWAYWAGTSFAAPIIAALTAQEWAKDPTRSAAQVIAAVRAHGAGGLGALEAPSIDAKSAY